jgi:SAM-dependent methyltransferase
VEITESRWLEAQKAEAAYWADAGHSSRHILYELTEHCQEIVPNLLRVLEGKSGLKAIEIGVGALGIGFLAVYAKPHCSEIVGIEPLPVQCIELYDKDLKNYAKALQSRVKMFRERGEKLPFDTGDFDLACCINVLDHTNRPCSILDEILRVTKRKGVFVLAVHTRSLLVRFKWRIQKIMRMESLQTIALPHTFSWNKLNKQLQESWTIRRQNRPSVF